MVYSVEVYINSGSEEGDGIWYFVLYLQQKEREREREKGDKQ